MSKASEPVNLESKKERKLFHVHYDSQYYGIIAARTRPEAFRRAFAKFGRHIIKDPNLLSVSQA